MNVLIATFAGLGNFLGTLPLIRGIARETRAPRIFLPELSGDFALSAPSILGEGLDLRFYPTTWRRFLQADWNAISQFIKDENIKVVLNWRNEGPEYDIGFYAFRAGIAAGISARFFDGWELGEQAVRRLTWWELAAAITRLWIPNVEQVGFPQLVRSGNRIDLFPIASTSPKRWNNEGWSDLLQLLLSHTDAKIGIHVPPDDQDVTFQARQSATYAGNRIRTFGPYKDVSETLRLLQTSSIAVTLDSFPAHLCALFGVPCVTCFFGTDPQVWAHRKRQHVVGGTLGNCPDWKPFSGNCKRYYSGCLPSCKERSKVAAREVLDVVLKLLNGST